MNLFFYLQTFILNYSFMVILSDHIFVLCFIKTQPFVKRKPVKTEKNTGTIAFRFRQVLLYLIPVPFHGDGYANASLYHVIRALSVLLLLISVMPHDQRVGQPCNRPPRETLQMQDDQFRRQE